MNTIRRGSAWIAITAVALLLLNYGPLSAQVASPVQDELRVVDQPAGEMKTVAVLAGTSYDKLISDFTLLGTLAGKPEAGQMVEGAFAFFTQGKGPNAIDRTKPWGVIVQTNGAQFLPVGCLPATKPEDLLEVAAAFGIQVKEGNDGVKELVLPSQQSVFVKQDAGWAFIGVSPGALAQLPENPQAILSELVTDYDLALRVSVKDVPEMYRQFAVQAMQAGMQEQMTQKPGESDELFKLRQEYAKAQMAQTVRTLNETDTITVGWAVDAQQQRTYIDMAQIFVSDSQTAKQIAAYGQPRTNFAGFYQPDAAATMTIAAQTDPTMIAKEIEKFYAMMPMIRQQIDKSIDESADLADKQKARDALKSAVGDFFDAAEATVKAGQFDGGATLKASADSVTLVAGALVKDSAKIESGLKQLELAKQETHPEFPGIQWNAASHAGVNFHTLQIPVPEHLDRPRKLLGDELSIAVGIGTDKVYLAVGRDSLAAVKQAIDASAAEPDKAVPPFEMAFSLGPIAEAAAAQADEGSQKVVAQAVADMLRNETQGRDHIRAVGQMIPDGVRYRFEAEEGVLRAIGKATAEVQRQALQAQQ